MMEAFKRRALEMREVVYRLTGYRVDTSGDNHYKLTSMYAESSDDYLLFEVARSYAAVTHTQREGKGVIPLSITHDTVVQM